MRHERCRDCHRAAHLAHKTSKLFHRSKRTRDGWASASAAQCPDATIPTSAFITGCLRCSASLIKLNPRLNIEWEVGKYEQQGSCIARFNAKRTGSGSNGMTMQTERTNNTTRKHFPFFCGDYPWEVLTTRVILRPLLADSFSDQDLRSGSLITSSQKCMLSHILIFRTGTIKYTAALPLVRCILLDNISDLRSVVGSSPGRGQCPNFSNFSKKPLRTSGSATL